MFTFSNEYFNDYKISLTKNDDLYVNDEPPKTLPLRPIMRGLYSGDDDNHQNDASTVYTEQHTEVTLNCEVDLDIAAVVWMHNGQVNFLPNQFYYKAQTKKYYFSF